MQHTNEKEKKEREANKGKAPDRPQTEEEEEEAFKKRRENLEAKEAEFLQQVFDRTFSKWTEKDWKRLKALYFKAIG